MNNKKLNQLFASARTEPAPAPSADFAADVLRMARGERRESLRPVSMVEQLNRWFPRIAMASAAIIVLCIAVDLGLTALGVPGVTDGLSEISAQWLLPSGQL